MARLPNSFLRRAHRINPLLVPLVRVCRDLTSATNELRWLKEHIASLRSNDLQFGIFSNKHDRHKRTLQRLCEARGQGVPLQYILGTEYFGELELLVKPGVLIPRYETASAVSQLLSLLRANSAAISRSLKQRPPQRSSCLQVLDLCTGSGCIPLLLQHKLNVPSRALGVDVSSKAISLARQNARRVESLYNTNAEHNCHFALCDIMPSVSEKPCQEYVAPTLQHTLNTCGMHEVDIVISNPPYIPPSHFLKHTERSVRNFEPRLALMPTFSQAASNKGVSADVSQGDAFYPRLFEITSSLVRPSIFLCEVGDLDQAMRVAAMAILRCDWDGVEIWRDEPTFDAIEKVSISGHDVSIVGQGHGRSVLCWRGEGASWLRAT